MRDKTGTREEAVEDPAGAGAGDTADAMADPAGETGSEAGAEDGSTEAAGGEEQEGVSQLRSELDALNDRHLRLAAEFDNYRRRNERERQSLVNRLQADLLTALLDVLDDLERVIAAGDESSKQSVAEGAELVQKKFAGVLEGAGVEPVDADGAAFNPEVMEALMTVPTDDPEQDGRVADVFQRGYRFRGTLLRPARVRVFEYQESSDSGS